jgi:molybdate transport system substrate-binding protein
MLKACLAAVVAFALGLSCAAANELRLLTTGAPRKVVDMVVAGYTQATGVRVVIEQDTAGGVRRRIEQGQTADIIVATPEVLAALQQGGRVAPGTQVDFARTGVGVGVKDGVARPDIATVDAFKAFLAAAPSIALPDPAAGGTSAVYIAGLMQRLGVADMVRAKARLKAGGYAADLVASGDAIYVIHQISEITPVKGVTLVGPLPAEIQLITTYSGALSTAGAGNPAARALMAAFAGEPGRAGAVSVGMDPVR